LWNYLPCEDGVPQDLSIPQTNPHAGLDRPIWSNDANDAAFISPIYERLETNIPRGLMSFSDLAWPDDFQLFPKHTQVLEYIKTYSREVQHLIQFNTQVVSIQPRDGDKWSVQTQPVTKCGESPIRDETFDAVVVANGHYDVPYIPQVSGIEAWNRAWPDHISHSIYYRKPEHFAGKKVVIVGNSASGIDIGAQISNVCTLPLIMSQKSESYLNAGGNSPRISERPEIVEYIVEDRSVRFADGTIEANVDRIVYCTGYFYSYPFLNGLDPSVISTGERVENTYQHIFYQPNPTLAFLALNQRVIPFPWSEAQSSIIARVFSGRLTVPTEDEMKAWENNVLAETGTGTEFHVMKFPKDADFLNMLHDWALSADGEGNLDRNGGRIGKIPPYWGKKEYWTREQFPKIKKAFGDLGTKRHEARTLEDVGFVFEESKDSP
jgi:cation diffusion facilitator CzcD-associated flavoprotein CzcO